MTLLSTIRSAMTRIVLPRLATGPRPSRGPSGQAPSDAERVPLKLAVIGTPRSGNTWLRRLLATAYGLEWARTEWAVHDPSDADWEAPSPFAIQVHVGCDPETAGRLDRAGVRVVTPLRHPFDVLISILQYANHQANEAARWLGGQAGDEGEIVGLDPCHPRFLRYARSPRAAGLLAVSPSWVRRPGTLAVRYEDLVARPEPVLDGLAASIGRPPVVGWPEAVAANTKDRLNRTHGRGHIWQGRPGLWRSLLTPEAASTLADAHRDLLAEGGDDPEPDTSLTPELAFANWQALAG